MRSLLTPRGASFFRTIQRSVYEFYRDHPVVAQYFKRLLTLPNPLEKTSCNLCGHSETIFHMQLAQFQVVRCARCSLTYVNPRYNEKQQAQLYSTDEYFLSGYDAEGHVHDMQKEKKTKQADLIYELQAINKLPGGRFLDIGCGLGFLLEMLSPSWERYGCDFSPYAVAQCRQAHLGNIGKGSLKDQCYPDHFFDAVCARYVLEHLRDPKQFLIEIRRILKPGGTLLISVPNLGSFCAVQFGEFFRLNSPEEHIYWFTRESITKYLRAAGFKVETIQYPYFRTSYFNPKELWRLIKRLFLLKVIMPIGMLFGERISANVISPPFYGNIIMVTARS